MRKLAICLAKGGVGKTTTATNLACGLASHGKKVLLVDCDTQGQAGFFLGIKPKEGLAEVLQKTRTFAEVVCEIRPKLDLLAGGRTLSDATLAIASRTMGIERALSEALRPAEGHYDLVILDMAPGWDLLSVNALIYAREIIAPVELQMAAVESLGQFVERVEDVQVYNPELTIRYVLPTMWDKRSKESQDILERLALVYPEQLCDPIKASVKLFEATGQGQSIFEYAPKSTGAADYAKLIARVLR
ncbi:MAG: ParA family protein [Bilophila sp.]